MPSLRKLVGVRLELDLIQRVHDEAERNRRNFGQEMMALLEDGLALRHWQRRQEVERNAAIGFTTGTSVKKPTPTSRKKGS